MSKFLKVWQCIWVDNVAGNVHAKKASLIRVKQCIVICNLYTSGVFSEICNVFDALTDKDIETCG